MDNSHPNHLLVQQVQFYDGKLLPNLEEGRVHPVKLEQHGGPLEQWHMMERHLVYLNEEIMRRNAELTLEREQRRRLEAKLVERDSELNKTKEQLRILFEHVNGERQYRLRLEEELRQQRVLAEVAQQQQQRVKAEEELRQTEELTRIDHSPQYQDVVNQYNEVHDSYAESLIDAAGSGDTEAVKSLIYLGAFIETKDSHNRTPLHIAARYGHIDTVQLLVALGAHVNAKTCCGYTVLHVAASYGHLNICRVLLFAGALVNQCNVSEETPLHNAAFNGHLPVVHLLLEHGANVTMKDISGLSACDHGNSKGYTDIVACLSAAERGVEVM